MQGNDDLKGKFSRASSLDCIALYSSLSRQPCNSSKITMLVVTAEKELRTSITFSFSFSLPDLLKLSIHADVSISILSFIAHFL